MKKKLCILTIFLLLLNIGFVYAADEDTEQEIYPESVYDHGQEAPLSILNQNSEAIDPLTGNLKLYNTDLSLPGKNGLNFELRRFYSLTQSNIYEPFNSKVLTFNEKYFDIGVGWAFDFPALEFRADTHPVIHYGSKGTFFTENYYSAEDGYKIQNYKLDDFKVFMDSGSFNSGQYTSEYKLVEYTGKTYYFNAEGYLIGITDKYDNTIKFQYTTKGLIYRGDNLYLSKVIDSVNREINFAYDNNLQNPSVTVSVNDGTITKTIEYKLKDIQSEHTSSDLVDGQYILDKVIDCGDQVADYDYEYKYLKYNHFNINESPSDTAMIYATVSDITYQSGATTQFITSTYKKFFGLFGYTEMPRLSTIVNREVDGSSRNNITYVYSNKLTVDGVENSVSYDGFPELALSDKTAKDSIADGDFIVRTYTVDHNMSSNMEEYFFDKNYSNTKLVRKGSNHKVEIEKTIHPYFNLPMQEKKTIYDMGNMLRTKTDDTIVTYKDYDYNANGQIIKYVGPEFERNASGGLVDSGYTYTVSYDSTYGVPTQQKKPKDDNGIYITENTLSLDKKHITSTLTFGPEGNVNKEDYTYDSYGNVTHIKKYYSINEGKYIDQYFEYTDSLASRNNQFDGLFMTRSYISGVVNSDGNLITPLAGNASGVIDTKQVFDYWGNAIETTDANGNTTELEYDKHNRVTKKINPDDSYTTMSYTINSSEVSIVSKDENWNAGDHDKGTNIKIYYDSFGNIVAEELYDHAQNKYVRTSETTINNRNQIESVENLINGTISEYKYLSDGRLREKEVTDSGVKLYKETKYYTDANNDGNQEVLTKVYEGTHIFEVESVVVTNKLGQTVEVRKKNGDGWVKETFKYNIRGLKTEEKLARDHDEFPDKSYTNRYEYDYRGNVTLKQNSEGATFKYIYDNLGRLIKTIDPKFNKLASEGKKLLGGIEYTFYVYDNAGRKIKESIPYQYNTAGTLIYGDKAHNKYDYDRVGNLTDEYIDRDNHESYIDKHYRYDERNRLVKTWVYESRPLYSQYVYDKSSNLLKKYTGLYEPLIINADLSVTPGRDTNYNVETYEYDSLGNVILNTDPLGYTESYEYDLNGNLLKKTDKNGVKFTFTYDGLNRLTQQVSGEDGNKITENIKYSGTGHAIEKTLDQSTMYFKYDGLGNLVEERTDTNKKTYSYDAARNRTRMMLFVNDLLLDVTDYSYDTLNRLSSVSKNSNNLVSYEYDINGNRTKETKSNNTVVIYEFNAANRVTKVTNSKAGTALDTITYTYYPNGSVKSKHDGVDELKYSYDDAGRLINEGTKEDTTIFYFFDDSSNIIQKTESGKGSILYTYDKNNRLITAQHPDKLVHNSYDKNGNTILTTEERTVDETAETSDVSVNTVESSSNVVLKEYNYKNQLIKIISESKETIHSYNAIGMRDKKDVDGVITKHVWDGGNIIADLDNTNAMKARYVFGFSIIAREYNSQTEFYFQDAHGDVKTLTNLVGDVVKRYTYNAYGDELDEDENDTNPFRYFGQYYDIDSGFYYLRARYYNPHTMRFINADIYLGELDDPLSLNRYLYCVGNPILFVDYTGNRPQYHEWDHAPGMYYFNASDKDYDILVIIAETSTLGLAGSFIVNKTDMYYEFSDEDIKYATSVLLEAASNSDKIAKGFGKASPIISNAAKQAQFVSVVISGVSAYEVLSDPTYEYDKAIEKIFSSRVLCSTSTKVLYAKYEYALKSLIELEKQGKFSYKKNSLYWGSRTYSYHSDDIERIEEEIMELYGYEYDYYKNN